MGETYQKLEETDQFKSFWKKSGNESKAWGNKQKLRFYNKLRFQKLLKKTEMDQKYDLKKNGILIFF